MAEKDDVGLPELSDGSGAAPDGQPLLKKQSPSDAEPKHSAVDLEAVYDVPVTVQAILGKSAMEVSQLLKLARGTVVQLDRLVARGEVVLVEDRLGVTMTEIIKAGQI